MRVGLQQCTYAWPGGPAAIGRTLSDIARTAEDAGFASFWLMDHLLQIPGWGPAGDPMLEAYSALGFVAARTTRIHLGTLVSAATYRPPAVVIKAATTLDVLSGGRAYLGVGAGWYEREAKALGLPFPPRRDRFHALEDVVRLARAAWSDDRSAFQGRTLRADDPVQSPAPLSRPHPPILIAGRGTTRTIDLVARYADAWNVIAAPHEGAAFLEALRRRCRDVGRDVDQIELTVLDPVDWRRDEDPAYDWSPAWELARLRRWRDIGFTHVIVNLPNAHELDAVRAYAGVIAALGA